MDFLPRSSIFSSRDGSRHRANRCSSPALGSLCSMPSCAATRPGAAPAPRPHQRRRVRQGPPRQRRRRRAARPALRRWRGTGACGGPAPAVARPRRPPALDAGRLAAAATRLDLALPDPNGLASSLKECAGEGDPISAAGKSAALVFSTLPDAPTAEAEILALWAFDLALAIRLRWPRPAPLIATKILDPSLRSDGPRRPRPTVIERGPSAPAGVDCPHRATRHRKRVGRRRAGGGDPRRRREAI
jgi:hypothetical protein